MNERIKVLAEQAGWKFALPVTGEYSGYDKVVDKFAELIITECANQILDQGTDYLDWQPSKTGIRPEYFEMAQHIKRHFGIE